MAKCRRYRPDRLNTIFAASRICLAFDVSFLVHKYHWLVQIHHLVQDGFEKHGFWRVDEYFERYALVNRAADGGYIVRPELHLVGTQAVVDLDLIAKKTKDKKMSYHN